MSYFSLSKRQDNTINITSYTPENSFVFFKDSTTRPLFPRVKATANLLEVFADFESRMLMRNVFFNEQGVANHIKE